MKKNKLIIIGIGETARLAHQYFTFDSEYEVAGFAVHKAFLSSDTFCDLPVNAVETLDSQFPTTDYAVFVAMGSGHLNRDRATLFQELKNKGYTCASYVSSRAFVWHDVKIGENCFILENNVVQSGCKIGDNVTLWSGNHVGHTTQIDDHCFISSHVVISGNVTVGKYCFIGVNSAIADNLHIQDDTFIGLATVINKNTEADSIYTGNPAVKSKVSAKKFSRVKD